MKLRYIVLAALVTFTTLLSGQANFHRTFPSNESGDTLVHHLVTATTTSGSMVSALGRQVDGEYKTIVFVKQDQKGNLDSKTEYDFGQDTISNIMDVDIIYQGDSIYFAMAIVANSELTGLVGSLTGSTTDDLTVNRVTGIDFTAGTISDDITGFPRLAAYYDKQVLYGAADEKPYITLLDSARNVQWSQSYQLSEADGDDIAAVSYGIAANRDSLIYSHGLLSNFSLYQLVVDSQSVETYAKAYMLSTSGASPVPAGIATDSKDGSAFAGYYSPTATNSVGYVVMTDTIGDVLWAHNITIDGASTEIYDVTMTTGGFVVVGGHYFPAPDSTRAFAAAINATGEVTWVSGFGISVAQPDLDHLSVDMTSDGGAVLATNTFAENGTEAISYIKVALAGSTPCSDTLDLMVASPLTVSTDTLMSVRNIGLTLGDTLAYEEEPYTGLIEPIINLDPRMKEFCPNEPINELIVASLTNVDDSKEAYLWSDENMTMNDSIIVMEEGMYVVTITVTENNCYMVCDTVNLTRTAVPEVVIVPDYNSFCETGEVTLFASIEGGQPQYTYDWTTGDAAQSIVVTEEGIYGVQIFDSCGDSAMTSFNLLFPDVTLDVQATINDQFCELGFVGLQLNPLATATIDGVIIPFDPTFSFSWNTGESTQDIQVTENGTYTYTVLDACGNVVMGSVDVTEIVEPGDDTEVTVDITADCDEENSVNSIYNGQADVGSDVSDFQWVTLDSNFVQVSTVPITSFEISNTERVKAFTYCYTVGCEKIFGDTTLITNLCETVVTGEECIAFANVFFPGETADSPEDSLDIVFKPYVRLNCPELAATQVLQEVISTEDYTFAIFNRYGQQVFLTDDINASWDGTFNGEPVPSETYIWYATYKYLGEEASEARKQKGDVTVVY